MNLIKLKLLRYLNHRANIRNKIPHINISFREARDFGLIFTWENDTKFNRVRELIKSLEIHGKEAHLICYQGNKKDKLPADVQAFTDRDISMFGKVRSQILKEFLNKSFDFILHLDLQQNIMTQFVLSRTRAKCRIGKTAMDFREFYEMMIQPTGENDYKDFCDQVMHYTKSIAIYA